MRSLGVLLVGCVTAGCAAGSASGVRILGVGGSAPHSTVLKVSVDSCDRQGYEVHVSESAAQVVVSVTTTAAGAQTAAACSDLVMVRLAEPLGSRPLIDATTGRGVPLDPMSTGGQPG